jgi:hypothetical protein
MTDDFISPVDLPGADDIVAERRPLLWITTVIAFASATLLAINAVALQGWVDALTPSGPQARAADLVTRWTGMTVDAGLDAPRAALHARWKAAQAARFEADGQR